MESVCNSICISHKLGRPDLQLQMIPFLSFSDGDDADGDGGDDDCDDDIGDDNDGDVVMMMMMVMLMMATTSPFLFLHRCQQQAAKVAEGSVSRLFARWMISIVVAASSLSS